MRKGISGPVVGADGAAHRFPVSVKGVVLESGRVALLKNERDEWELPGGKLEIGEDPRACVEREILEELGWEVQSATLLDCWLYRIRDNVAVLIVTYGCHKIGGSHLVTSDEHSAGGTFTEKEVNSLPMPAGYRASISNWFRLQEPTITEIK